jgi:pilus assembly protein Flp/PilA
MSAIADADVRRTWASDVGHLTRERKVSPALQEHVSDADQRSMRPIFSALQHQLRLVGYMLVRLSSERGQTMAEYGILIGVIAVVVVVAAVLLGGNISDLFKSASSHL